MHPHIKKFFNREFYIYLSLLLAIDILIILIFQFWASHYTVAYVFIGYFCVLLIPFVGFWISFKGINTKVFKNKTNSEGKLRGYEKSVIDRFYINVEHNLHNYKSALIRNVYWYLALWILPAILTLTLILIYSFI